MIGLIILYILFSTCMKKLVKSSQNVSGWMLGSCQQGLKAWITVHCVLGAGHRDKLAIYR